MALIFAALACFAGHGHQKFLCVFDVKRMKTILFLAQLAVFAAVAGAVPHLFPKARLHQERACRFRYSRALACRIAMRFPA